LDGLSQVGDRQLPSILEIGDCARYFKDAVMGARGESLLLHGSFEQALGIWAQLAIGSNLPGCHLRIGVDLFAVLFEALALAVAGGEHAGSNFSGTLDGG
jgi:hypothetical protein